MEREERRDVQRSSTGGDAGPLERLIEALERDDHAEVDRIRRDLAAEEEQSLLELEGRAERTAGTRSNAERILDRLRNVFQALLLHRCLRGKRP